MIGATLRPGTLFRHARLLDTTWQPGPGERYADAPPAVCRITAVRSGRAYYRIGREPGRAHAWFPLADAADHVRAVLTEPQAGAATVEPLRGTVSPEPLRTDSTEPQADN